MKAMVLTGLNQIKIIEKPVPVIHKADEVLIRMKSVGICGSDIHYYREGKIGSQIVAYPFTVGHEGAGIVEKTGDSVTSLKPGDRVALDPAMPCYHCEQCNLKRYHTCKNLKFLGCPGQSEGCLSEFIVMPAGSCYKINDTLTLDQAALSEPLAIGLYATTLSLPLKNKRIGILGSGPIGISVLLPSLFHGAEKIYMTDKINERLSIASVIGAHWTGNPDETDVKLDILDLEPLQLDVIFECCGSQDAINQAVKLLKPGGKLLIIGIPSFERWSFDVDDLRRKELIIQNVRRQNESVQATINLIAEGKINPDKMLTHTFPFEKIEDAFEMVASYTDGVMKAMINFV